MAKVVHFEIPFDNKARAMKFYADEAISMGAYARVADTEGNIIGLFQSY